MRYYFMGICGTAMGNAALLLRAIGHDVVGSDSGVYPPMSEVLRESGIEVFEGFQAKRLAELAPDRVVVGNAMSRGNSEVEWLLNQSDIPYLSLPQLFHDEILVGRQPVVITGTHGKTTTSALTAFLLRAAGQDPGWLIGGVPLDLTGGAHLGGGAPFVIEGDEYDSAFFDKRSKFIHYRPRVAVINNLEFDHADIFRDLEDVLRSFRHFTRIIPSNGKLIVNGDDPNVSKLLPVDWTEVFKVGEGGGSDLIIANFRDGPDGASFDLSWRGRHWASVNWKLHGFFNARNGAMAALSAAFTAGHEDPTEFELMPLDSFRGVRRRQDVLLERTICSVVEDFAHHPTAIDGALEALRAKYPERRLIACFEPRSNTARTVLFQARFEAALTKADSIYLGAVHRADQMGDGQRLDTTAMASGLMAIGLEAQAFTTNSDLEEHLLKEVCRSAQPKAIVFFTNGSFDGLPRKIAEALAAD